MTNLSPRIAYRTLRLLAAAVLLGGALSAARGVDVAAAGSWSRVVSVSDLQSGAGSDLTPTLLSDPSAVLLTVSGTSGPADTWRVDIRRTDLLWHPDLVLSARRTGDGVGGGAIAGGDSFLSVGESDTTLCTGAGDRALIPLQFRVTGLAVGVPPAIYSTTITYTVVDLL